MASLTGYCWRRRSTLKKAARSTGREPEVPPKKAWNGWASNIYRCFTYTTRNGFSFEEAMAPSGPVAVLRELVAEGRVGSLGVAGGPIDLLLRFARTGIFQVVLTHNRWTLLDRSAGPLLDHCADAGIPVLNAAPFGGGVLAQGLAASQRYAYRPAPEAVLKALEAIEGVCTRHDVPLAAAALQFSLRDDRVISTVVGMSVC